MKAVYHSDKNNALHGTDDINCHTESLKLEIKHVLHATIFVFFGVAGYNSITHTDTNPHVWKIKEFKYVTSTLACKPLCKVTSEDWLIIMIVIYLM